MRLSTEVLNASVGLTDGMSYRTLSRYDERVLYEFYCSLNQEERRIRFGCAVSDDAIARHCDQIDWRSTLVIALGTALRLDAVSVNVRIDTRRVENATIATATKDSEHAVTALLRLSAVGARDLFAAERMLISLEGANWLLRHLREIGSTIVTDDFAEFDLTSIIEQPFEIDRARSSRIRVDARAAPVSS